MLTSEQIQSRTIALLRFPLIVAVVFIHCTLEKNLPHPSRLYLDLVYVTHEQIAGIAVPLFFFMSGFLFFYKCGFNRTVYGTKLRKRARTLLIPYLLWNVIYIVLFWTAQGLFPQMFSGNALDIRSCTPLELLQSLFFRPDGYMPVNTPMWFIRDLMVVMLASPVVFLLVRYGKRAGILALLLLFLAGQEVLQLNGAYLLNVFFGAFSYFTFGAWFSIRGKLFTDELRPWYRAAAVSLVVCFAADFLLHESYPLLAGIFHRGGLLSGIVTAVGIARWGTATGRMRPVARIWSATFFVYAYHIFFSSAFNKIPTRLFPDAPAVLMLLANIGCALATVALGIGLYHLLARLCPRLTALLCGGR